MLQTGEVGENGMIALDPEITFFLGKFSCSNFDTAVSKLDVP